MQTISSSLTQKMDSGGLGSKSEESGELLNQSSRMTAGQEDCTPQSEEYVERRGSRS